MRPLYLFFRCLFQVRAVELAYDRPSPKMIRFLQKHFGLSSWETQQNHFVIFDEFWRERREAEPRRRGETAKVGGG